MRALAVFLLTLSAAPCLKAQACPTEVNKGQPSTPSVLHGTLVIHDDLRKWVGLKLDHLACGQTEIQLVFSKSEVWRIAESLRGCSLTVTGALYESPTGYYSAHIAISNGELKPGASCHPAPVEPEPSKAAIPPAVTACNASIRVDYRGSGHVDVKVWQGNEQTSTLAPWEAYVSYTLTGGADVIWFSCQKDFAIGNITQTPARPGGIIDDQPRLTGTALQDMNGMNVIKFICQRKPANPPAKDKDPHPKPDRPCAAVCLDSRSLRAYHAGATPR